MTQTPTVLGERRLAPPVRTGPAPAFRELGYWLHRYRRIWRGTAVVTVVNPLLFLTALGAGLGRLVNASASAGGAGRLHGVPYLHFIVPGLLAAAVMQTAYIESAGPVMQSMQTRGNYRAAAATPLDPAEILYGHLIFMALRITMTAAAFTVISALFGTVGAARIVPVVLAATLTGLAFAGPVAAWAVGVTRPAQLQAMLRFVIMPLYMLSGTFFPLTGLPGWVQGLATVTPLWHGTELCRTLALGTASWAGTLTHVVYLGAMAGIGLVLARRGYRRHLHP